MLHLLSRSEPWKGRRKRPVSIAEMNRAVSRMGSLSEEEAQAQAQAQAQAATKARRRARRA